MVLFLIVPLRAVNRLSFRLDQVIPGWNLEGVQLMKEGGKTRFTIPSNLADGENLGGGTIPPELRLSL